MSQNTVIQRFWTQLLSPVRIRQCILWAVLPAALCYIVLLRLLTFSGFSVLESIKDPAQQTRVSSWLGLLSNLGVFVTFSAAVICFFALSTRLSMRKQKRECLFLVGLLSALIAFDDFFLIHDRHMSEKTCYLIYAVFLLALLWRHYRTILKVDAPAFLLAGGFLALSIFTDLVQGDIALTYGRSQILEEGFKFVGMSTWLYFSYRLAITYVLPVLPESEECLSQRSG